MRASIFLLVSSLAACGGSVESEPGSDAGIDSAATDVGRDAGSDLGSDVGIDRSCASAGMCALVPASCCGSCGVPTKSDQLAIPRDKQGEYRTLACSSDSGPVGCPGCAGMPDPELQAFCRGGACVPVFVPSDSVSACAKDEDCVLVAGECCACDGERSLVSIAKGKESEFLSQICDPRIDCAPCPAPAPTRTTTRCDPATRHCVTLRAL